MHRNSGHDQDITIKKLFTKRQEDAMNDQVNCEAPSNYIKQAKKMPMIPTTL